MTQQFQGFLKHRRITLQEKLGFDNVHIFKPNSSSAFVKLLKLGLDNLYLERLLENGTCTVCCEATSKFCSICGTNYCSVNCQSTDWERHQLVCENIMSSISTSSKNCDDVNNQNISHTNVIPAQPEGNEVGVHEESMKDNVKMKQNDSKSELKPNEELYSSKTENTANAKDECPKALPLKNYHEETEARKSLSKRIRSKKRSSMGSMTSAASESEIFCISPKFERFKTGQSYKIKFLSWVENGLMCYVIPLELENALKDLQAKLQNSYHNYEHVKNAVEGETYLALINKEWCRVKVKKAHPKITNNSQKINVRRVDLGGYCSPKIEEMRELPPEIKALKPLATMVKFTVRIKAFSECSVKVIGFETNGIPIVTLNNAFKSSAESIVSTGLSDKTVKHMPNKYPSTEEINSNKNKTTQSKKSANEILNEELDHPSYRRCIVSELKNGIRGFFHCVKTDNRSMYGYLTPANNEAAADSMRRKSNLDGLPLEEIIARPGDIVMVQEGSGRYSGTVEKKSLGIYSVYLHDCNYSTSTKKVYKLDKSCYNTIDLGCHIILDHEILINLNLTVKEEKYPVYVRAQKSTHSWHCKIRVMDVDVPGTIMEALTPCESYIPMQSGCSVFITSIGEVRKHGDSAEIPIYVQLASTEWQSFFNEYFCSFRKTITNEYETTFHKGELVFAKDTYWNRAKVLESVKHQIKVLFVDLGYEKLLHLNAVRKMPGIFKNMPFFSRLVKVHGSQDHIMKKVDHLAALMKKKTILLMTYDSEMTMNVKLSVQDSNETESQIKSSKSDDGNDKRTFDRQESDKKDRIIGMTIEMITKLSCLAVGPVPHFSILHVEDEEFESEGIFWGTNVANQNFKYVAGDLGREIAQYCNSSKDAEYHPEVGELCLAIYEDEWYRGLIVNKFDQRFEVFFIDFGNKSLVGPKKIRKKCSNFFMKEPLAARCVLSGFQIMTAKERESALEYLNLMVNERISVYVEEVTNGVNYVRIPEVEKN